MTKRTHAAPRPSPRREALPYEPPVIPETPSLFTDSQLTMVNGGWVLTRFVLIREIRSCLCGSVHTATASHPRVELMNRHGDIRTCSMQDVQGLLVMLTSKLRVEFKWPTLPRSIMDVEIPVSSCEECFTALEVSEDASMDCGYPLSLTAIRRLLTFAEEMQPTPEELRAARDGRMSSSKPCSPAVVPLDLSLL